jgi:hypothetical protein
LDVHTPVARSVRLNEVFALEEERILGNDWVIQYHHQALQVRASRAAQRHVMPGRRIFVRESEAGELRLIVVHPETDREYELTWERLADERRIAPTRPQPVRPSSPIPPAPEPVALDTCGRAISVPQLAMRARWDHLFQRDAARRAARKARSKGPASQLTP